MKLGTKRLGIIGSSGGSSLIAATKCLEAAGKRFDWVVITDRKCGLEHWASANGYESHRLAYGNVSAFSRDACSLLQASGCGDVLLFYSRRIASPLIHELRVWNIHPALLPAFAGLHAVEHAVTAGVRLLGATLHRVDAELDTGPIVAQVAAVLPSGATLEHAQHLSYLQKVWLTLVWFENLSSVYEGEPSTTSYCPGGALANPGIADESLLTSYAEWLLREEDGNRVGICG